MPVPTVRRLQKTLPDDAEVYTPYGATECLPVASVSGAELNDEVEHRTAAGEGTCIGYPVAPNRVKIIPVTDNVVSSFEDTTELPVGICGEIVVSGPTSTDSYWQRPEQTLLAKITDSNGEIWHRMGDAGYFDTEGRLWYCGRKSQRVVNQHLTMFADQIEAIFNIHPEVARTALVGIGTPGRQTPVLCVEPLNKPDKHRSERIRIDLLQIGRNNAATSSIQHVLFHKSFPVDIRHNAKIGREKLALWAAEKLS
jgi:acyl-CoA synthetase (AMP-forming)/AMP-acid ligase II